MELIVPGVKYPHDGRGQVSLSVVGELGSPDLMPTVGSRVRALREALDLSTYQLAARGSGAEGDRNKLRDVITKVENDRNHLTSARSRETMARCFGMPVDRFVAYIEGRASVDDAKRVALADPAPSPPPAVQTAHGASTLSFDAALTRAFRDSPGIELADVDAVRAILRPTAGQLREGADLDVAVRTWLRAASTLRGRGESVTVTSLLLEMATAAERAAIAVASDRLNGDGDKELRALRNPGETGLRKKK